MKKILFFILSVLFTLSFACNKKDETPPAPKSGDAGSVMQPVQNYANGLEKSIDKAKGVQATTDLADLQNAVRNYQMENGRYPDSLDAVKPYTRAGMDMSRFDYNPATGLVNLK